MPLFNFGQPYGSIVQMAFTVPDARAAIADYIKQVGLGPWFLFENFRGINATYRGQPSDASVTLAAAFSGHSQIELIQCNDGKPSVFREVIEQRGYGFHHMAITADDVEAKAQAMAGDGWEQAFSTELPSGDKVIYVSRNHPDTPQFPGMIEIVPSSASRERLMTRFYKAAMDWDGTDPIRSFF